MTCIISKECFYRIECDTYFSSGYPESSFKYPRGLLAASVEWMDKVESELPTISHITRH